MIYLDGVGFSFLAKELDSKLKNTRINKIIAYDDSSFSIYAQKHNLYFENKSEPIIYLKESKLSNTDYSSSFALILKKMITGAFIKSVTNYNKDRIIVLNIEKLNMLGEIENYRLIYEFLGKLINVVLVDEKDVIRANMFVNINMDRNLLKNSNYIYPNKNSSYGKYMKDLEAKKRELFEKEYKAILYKNNLFTYNEFLDEEYEEFPSLNEGLDIYFSRQNKISSLENKKKPIRKYINNNIKRINKILEKIPLDLKANQNYDIYKEYGDILAANIYLLKNNEESVNLYNFYNNQMVEIKLDKSLKASKNIKLYYDKYNKAKRREQSLTKRIEELKVELSYYEEQLYFLEQENDLLGVEEIEKEFNLVKSKIKSTKTQKRELYVEEYKGYKIYVGRNSKENETITFNIANSNDIWLHAKDTSGPHVIIKGENPSMDVIEYAAMLAIKNTNAKEVDYCKRKFVKKIPNGKRGQVTYKENKSINRKKEI